MQGIFLCRKERQGLCPAFHILYSWILKLLRNFAVSAVLWSIIWLLPISKSAMASISSFEREKSQILRFSWILSSWVDFGIMITPRSIFHRSAICTAVLPYFCPIPVSTGFVKIPNLPSARGAHACGWTPNSFMFSNAPDCAKKGCSSTWFTIGAILAFKHKSARRSG